MNMIKKFWTIKEADVGGMLGGYPRWLDKNGWYGATETSAMKKFLSKEEVLESTQWNKVQNNRDYSIVSFQIQYRPLTESERNQRLETIEKYFDELENGHSYWMEIKE